MKLNEQLIIMENLIEEIKKEGMSIASYGSTWVTVENPNYPECFIYLQLGDGICSHTGLLYKKVSCYQKKQYGYPVELAYGNNIVRMLDYVKNPFCYECVSGDVPVQRNYMELYTVLDDRKTILQHITSDWTNEDQKKVLSNLVRIEMIQTETDWGIVLGSERPTIIRFHGKETSFDFNFKERKVA